MSTENNEEIQFGPNISSRFETIDALIRRMKEHLLNMDEYSALAFTQHLVDDLLRDVHQLATYEETKNVDELLNKIINQQP